MNILESKSNEIINRQLVPTEKTYVNFEKLCAKAFDHFSDKSKRFENKSILPDMTREARIRFIKVLIQKIQEVPIINTPKGRSIKPLDSQVPLLTLTTHGFSANQLRGSGRGNTLLKGEYPFISRWTPLVMHILADKHNLMYEDFWIKGNPLDRVLLGRDLKDLTIPIKEKVLLSLTDRYTYYIKDGERLKTPHKDARIIRFKSPIFNAFYDEWPKSYEPGMSKTMMKELLNVK